VDSHGKGWGGFLCFFFFSGSRAHFPYTHWAPTPPENSPRKIPCPPIFGRSHITERRISGFFVVPWPFFQRLNGFLPGIESRVGRRRWGTEISTLVRVRPGPTRKNADKLAPRCLGQQIFPSEVLTHTRKGPRPDTMGSAFGAFGLRCCTARYFDDRFSLDLNPAVVIRRSQNSFGLCPRSFFTRDYQTPTGSTASSPEIVCRTTVAFRRHRAHVLELFNPRNPGILAGLPCSAFGWPGDQHAASARHFFVASLGPSPRLVLESLHILSVADNSRWVFSIHGF